MNIFQALKDKKAALRTKHRKASDQTLIALNQQARTGTKHIYAGTVPYKDKVANRKRNKAARKSRRINRRG